MVEQSTTHNIGSLETSPKRHVIVGIGASAGGLEALERFVSNIPADSGLAYVIVQHLSPDFKSLMDELLRRKTNVRIERVEDGMLVESNTIYLIPPKKNMVIEDDKLRLIEQDHSNGLNLPIDVFLKSLAKANGSHAVAVILSGSGSDGAEGVKRIAKAGGFVAVQTIQSAAFDGMPRATLATGVASLVCVPEQMPGRILEYLKDPTYFEEQAKSVSDEDLDDETAVVFNLFRKNYGIDFRFYKPSTIQRRIQRRVQLSRSDDLPAYLKCLEHDTREVETLYRDLLVEVTQFFRDPAAFESLRKNVVDDILHQARGAGEIRIWVPGCATGEEAYSLAMLFHDRIEATESKVDLKVFATDVHQTSMETASTAVYSSEAIRSLPAPYIKRYLTQVGGLFHVAPEIRQSVIFAPHDITKDPPFTRIDLISCRNVLIYLNPDVQKRVLSLFHFGLSVGGCLFLGPSESVGELDREFDSVDRNWRIFRKIRNVRLPNTGPLSLQPALKSVVVSRPTFVSTATRADRSWFVPEVYDHLLSKYVPPSLLVNQHHELVHSFGDARELLVQPQGRATLDVTKMVTGEFRIALSAALHKAEKTNSTVVFRGVRIQSSTGERRFNVIAEPYVKTSDLMFLVCLEEIEDPAPESLDASEEDFDPQNHSVERMIELERELDYTRETLQATVEELETSNEELQSTNEELVASNEELQSTNEELHSVNEELYTVNAEHQKKISELTSVTNDMEKFFRCTGFATIFLDGTLKIRKFTEEATEIFHVLEQDIGRPIHHIAHSLKNFDIVKCANEAIESGTISEAVATSNTGKQFLVRTLPYDSEEQDNGVVVTLIDATLLINRLGEMGTE